MDKLKKIPGEEVAEGCGVGPCQFGHKFDRYSFVHI